MNKINEKLLRQASAHFGRMGGKKTSKKYGPKHFKELAKLSHAKRKANKEKK